MKAAVAAGGENVGLPLETLPDYLCPRPRLFLVGLNPGAYSVQVGHYYGRRSNRFWPLLSASGLVPREVTREDDALLPRWGVAITDMVKRSSPNIDTLTAPELVVGGQRIVALARELSPAVVAFNGLAGYRTAFDAKARVGLQPLRIAGRPTWVLPSTSPRAIGAFSWEAQLELWKELARDVPAMGEPS
jgi:TDG/mug DNA glycosylase family protein